MRKADVVTKDDIQKYYDKVRKIKILGQEEKISLTDVFYRVIVAQEATTFTRGGHQCEKLKARSLDDYFKIAKFYHPEAKVEEMFEPIVTYYNAPYDGGIRRHFGYCPNIRKDNFRGHGYTKMHNLEQGEFKQQGFNNCTLTFKEYLA